MRKIICFLVATAFIFNGSAAFSQSTTVVMKAMDGTTKLSGGSTVSGHINEIDILSNSQGESFCKGCAKPDISSFNIMISVSPATISFKKLLLNGTKLTSVDVTYIKGGTTPVTYYIIHMENVLVENVQESASSEAPVFSVSLTPDRIAWKQIRTAGTGATSSYGWDLTTNTEWLYVF